MKTYASPLRACLSFFATLALSVTAFAQPTLVSTSPTTGATGVATNVAVVFQFSERMNVTPPEAGLTWVALIGGTMFQSIDAKMTYQWTSDRSFTARCTGGFPSGVLIAWDMTAFDFTRFIDDSELTQDYSGGFNTAAGSGGGGGGGGGAGTGDARLSVVVQANYSQLSAAAPVLVPTNSYQLSADVGLPPTRIATAATVTPPGKPVLNLFGTPLSSPTNFVTVAFSNSLAQLQASFPVGTYQFSIQGPSSNQVASVTLPAGSTPSAPSLVNYTLAQTVDPALPFTLQLPARQKPPMRP